MACNRNKIAIIVVPICITMILLLWYRTNCYKATMTPIFLKVKTNSLQDTMIQTLSLDTLKYPIKLRENINIKKNLSFRLNQITRCYEINGRPIIWLYWDKDEMPAFAKIFADAIQCVNSEFQVLIIHDSTLAQFWPDVNFDLFNKLVPAHKADVIRVNMLRIYGGVYLDIDTFPTQSYYQYYQLLPQYDMVGADWQGIGPLATGSMGPVKAGHLFFRVWSSWQAECMRVLINKKVKSDPFGWSELLARMAGPLANHMMRNNALKYYAFRGVPTIGQLVTRRLSRGWFMPLSKIINPLWNLTVTPILAVTHARQAATVDKLTLNDILAPCVNDTVFTYFAKCALLPCYANLSVIDKLGKSQLGDVYLLDYYKFVSVAPEYRCYDFNDSIPEKISDPKIFRG